MNAMVLNELFRLTSTGLFRYLVYAYDFDGFSDSITVKYECLDLDRKLFVTVRKGGMAVVRFLRCDTDVAVFSDRSCVADKKEIGHHSLALDKVCHIKVHCDYTSLCDVCVSLYNMYYREIPF